MTLSPRRFISVLLAALVLGGASRSGATPTAEGAKTQATAALKLLTDGNYEAYVDTLYSTMIDSLGGRGEAPGWISQKWMQLIAQHWTIKRAVGDVAQPVTANGKAFTVVPVLVTMESPTQRSVTHSYFVAISTDGGATWKFVDAATQDPQSIRADFVPDLPASVQLPEHEDPQLSNK